MKVILAHPGQQHSFKVATALKHQGMLYKYFTCVYDKPGSLTMKLVHKIVKGADIQKTNNRRCPALDDSDVITHYTFLSLCVIILSRFTSTKKFSYWLDRTIADYFGVKVAKYAIKHNVDAVICFSMNETRCFEYLKKKAPHIIRIVDCANSPVDYMRHIYDIDIAKTGIKFLKEEVPSFWDKKELKKQMQGIKSSEYFLAPSNFVKKGLVYCGVNPICIKVLHYGSNFIPIESHHTVAPTKIRFVYVGQVTFRKGMHYLLSVFESLNREDISLDVVGGWKPNSELYKKYKNSSIIKFWGNVPHEKVKEILMKSDVFVFSSLTEGFSLSCIEALSCALPLICSNNSGANDVIKEGVNGFKFDYDDVDGLTKIINKLADNKDSLVGLSLHALKTAKMNTWESYESNLGKVLADIIENKCNKF